MARSINRLSDRTVKSVTKPGRHADGGNLFLIVDPPRTARDGSTARVSASVAPTQTPAARAASLAAWMTRPRAPVSTSANGRSAGTAPGFARARHSVGQAGNHTETRRGITPLHGHRYIVD